MKITVLFTLLFSFTQASMSFAQGLLSPPGPPAPTMKTLDQIDTQVAYAGEKRTPIDATHTPGDSTNQFIINAPGSYYLTGNITGASGKNGITIKSDDVAVDLNGFALIGGPGSVNGIFVQTAPAPYQNLRIHNGSAQGWGSFGIGCGNASNSHFDHLRVSQNFTGFFCGGGSVISEISAEANDFRGILNGSFCTLNRCTASANKGDGITASTGTTLISCVSQNNSGKGFSVNGVALMRDCAALGNRSDGINTVAISEGADGSTLDHCTASANTGYGIYTSDGCTITACTANYNLGAGVGIRTRNSTSIVNCTATQGAGDGIQFANSCLITGNNSSNNGLSGTGGTIAHGFHSSGSLNRVDSNTASKNTGNGFFFPSGSDYVTRNTANSNTGTGGNGDYNPATAGNMGPVGNLSTATSPWANFR